jgi:hypothetical protein
LSKNVQAYATGLTPFGYSAEQPATGFGAEKSPPLFGSFGFHQEKATPI